METLSLQDLLHNYMICRKNIQKKTGRKKKTESQLTFLTTQPLNIKQNKKKHKGNKVKNFIEKYNKNQFSFKTLICSFKFSYSDCASMFFLLKSSILLRRSSMEIFKLCNSVSETNKSGHFSFKVSSKV